MLHGAYVQAIPDTGAQSNIISKHLAEALGLELFKYESESDNSFRLPTGKMIHAIGFVKASWQFLWEPLLLREQVLAVLPECVFDVLIGSPFLRLTKSMSTNKHRISRMPRANGLRVRCVNLVGCPSQRMMGMLGSEPVAALPDYGSEPNLISHEYAKSRGWVYDSSVEYKNLIMFADGSTDETAGEITLPWTFGNWTRGSTQTVRFSVLHGCVFDVILGQDFLDDTDAFARYPESFRDTVDDAQGLGHVIWAPKKTKQARPSRTAQISTDAQLDATSEEMERRAATDRQLRRMKDPEQRRAAELIEHERRNAWERRVDNHQMHSSSQSSAASSSLDHPPSSFNAPRTSPVATTISSNSSSSNTASEHRRPGVDKNNIPLYKYDTPFPN